MANPASNYANLSSLSPTFLSTGNGSVQNAIQTFMTAPIQANYEAMVTEVQAAQTLLATGTNASLRTLISVSDGRVAYDSSKTNTWAAYSEGTINDNHNTRPEIMLAVLSSGGSGQSNRYSSTSASSLKYLATRLGNSPSDNLGTFRISLTN